MEIISVRQRPKLARAAIAYFQKQWATQQSAKVYEDCILSCLDSGAPLPQWYLLMDGPDIIGCAGLVTNDFISRMDLWPWLCALYIEEKHRGNAYAKLLIERVKADARELGFSNLYLSTDLSGFYEKYGFSPLAQGYHPWGDSSTIFQTALSGAISHSQIKE